MKLLCARFNKYLILLNRAEVEGLEGRCHYSEEDYCYPLEGKDELERVRLYEFFKEILAL